MGPNCSHMYPLKREAEGDLVEEEKAMWPWRQILEKAGGHHKLEEARDGFSLKSLLRKCNLANILISVQ